MYRLLSITLDDIDENIAVSTTEVAEEGTHPTRPTSQNEDYIISLLKSCLNTVWYKISRIATPKSVVVSLEEINKVCRSMFCPFLDRDWPLRQLNISPLGDMSGRNALKMAASYYKRLDSPTLPRFTQPLPKWLESSQFAQPVKDLLWSNERYLLGHSVYLKLRSEDVKHLDCADIFYLARRSSIAIITLCGKWDATDLALLVPHFRDMAVSLCVDEPLFTSGIPLLIQIIWQNPKMVYLYLNPRSMIEFTQAVSNSSFFPVNPCCDIDCVDASDYAFRMEYAMQWAVDMAWEPGVSHRRFVYEDMILPPAFHHHTLLQSLLVDLPLYPKDVFVVPPSVHELTLTFGLKTSGPFAFPSFEFPSHLQYLSLSLRDHTKPIPIDLFFQFCQPLPYLEHLELDNVLGEPQGTFPTLENWPYLTSLSLNLTTVMLAHRILALVPTIQWRGLYLEIEGDNPSRPGLFEGLEDEDWSPLTNISLDFVDFMKHADMFRQCHELEHILVAKVPLESSFWSRFLQVFKPDTHPHLLSIYCENENDDKIKMTKEEKTMLRSFPSLVEFPSSGKQGYWNRVRQSRLVDLAAHPLWLNFNDTLLYE